MKKLIILFVLILPFLCSAQYDNTPWYESNKNNNLFFDAVGVSHTFGRIGAGIVLRKDRYIFGGEYGRYNYVGETLDIVKFSFTYMFYPNDIVSILGGCGYNIETIKAETLYQKKLSLEFGAMRNFKRMGVSINFDFVNTEGRLTLYYNL